LPDIDVDAPLKTRNHINKLISAELPAGYQSTLHPSLRPLPAIQFSELFQKELERKADNAPMVGGIDLTRYEAPEKPADDSEIETWRKSLRQAYMSSSYLSGRLTNLSLLEEFGKNAWLISNSQLEDILKDLEKELSEQKEAVENINKSRKAAQEGARAELVGLEEAWKQGVGKTIEVQLATDGVRREILQRRRNIH
jgi:pre-mRNA-splicing factor SPF27